LKTLEFVNSRRPDLEARANFLNQLQVYTKRSKTTIEPDCKDKLKENEEYQSKSSKIIKIKT